MGLLATIMLLRNTQNHYGLVAILLHWIMAVLILGLFILGQYMVDLDYYHPWYLKAPDFHRGLGILVVFLLLLRWIWRLANPRPKIEGKPWEQRIALWVHRFFYVLIACTVTSGYLISTADGQGVDVFGWFTVPALLQGAENQADLAGQWHEVLAYTLIALALVHSLAALKHHFINRDATLRRILLPDSLQPASSHSKTMGE